MADAMLKARAKESGVSGLAMMVDMDERGTMSAYTPPDKIEIYAAALQSDINSERAQQSR